MPVVLNNNTIKRFHKFQTGIPQLSTWGDLTTMLDAVLANGFNAKVPTAISRVDTTVTVSCTAHGYEIDQVLLAANADQPEYNGEHRVTFVSANSYSYELPPGITPAATGTTASAFAVKAAPLGFEILFSGTNRRAYRTLDTVNTNRPCLRVDDGLTFSGTYGATWSRYGKISVSQGMTDVDTFTGFKTPIPNDVNWPRGNEEFIPSSSGNAIYNGFFRWYYAKHFQAVDSSGGDPATPDWDLIGDSRGFHFFPMANASWNGAWQFSFTEFDSFVPGDTCNTWLSAAEYWGPANNSGADNSAYYSGYSRTANAREPRGKRILGDHTGYVGNESGEFFGPNWGISSHLSGFGSYSPYPNPADYSLILFENTIAGSRSGIRGVLPGIYGTPHATPLTPKAKFSGVASKPGRKFIALAVSGHSGGAVTTGQIYVDLTGPWRAS